MIDVERYGDILAEAGMEALTAREDRFIALRYGLKDYRPHTYEEIGVLEDISRERVRQIVLRAEAKMAKRLRALALKLELGNERKRGGIEYGRRIA